MPKNLRSIYKENIKRLIDFKRNNGYHFKVESFLLHQIDDLAYEMRINSLGITSKLDSEWRIRRANESYAYLYKRVLVLEMFSEFLDSLGIKTIRVVKLPYKKNNFTPYIFNQDEIHQLFKLCDSLKSKKLGPKDCLVSIPTILRTLYSTGIRISELKNLKKDDLNLNNRTILVKDVKNKLERLIPISESLAKILIEYIEIKKSLLGSQYSNSTFLFINRSGERCNNIREWYRQCLENMNFELSGIKNLPRIHDLRHTFAVTSLTKMIESGIDIYAALPILSTYLGHQSIKSTDMYVRLTQSMYPNLIKEMDIISIEIYPKLKTYEND